MAGCIFAGLLISSYKLIKHQPCKPITLHVKQGPLFAGEFIAMTVDCGGKTPSNITWDFGDKSPIVKGAPTVNHLFSQPGNYDIAVAADGECTEFNTINIVTPPPAILPVSGPCFSGPKTAVVGVRAVFRDSTQGATKWEWRFGEGNAVDASTAKASYIFRTPGTKEVILVVNETKQGSMIVEVQQPFVHKVHPPAPSKEAHIEPHHAPDVTNAQLQDFLKQVIEGHKTALDLAGPLCGNLNIPVTFNNGKEKIPFVKLCNDLRDLKDKKIKSINVSAEKDSLTHCIRAMKVDLKKKGFLFF
jgi:hypothetical protein